MEKLENPIDTTLSYPTDHDSRQRGRLALVLTILLFVYLVSYLLLRVSGVYHLFWNQGDWDSIDGSVGFWPIDLLFLPMMLIELFLQNAFHLTPPPSGG